MSTTDTIAAADPQLDTGDLKKFAQAARRQLMEQVESKLDRVLAEGSLARLKVNYNKFGKALKKVAGLTGS